MSLGTKMQTTTKTARELYEEVKANPKRARFGFGQKAAIVNVDPQQAYTRIDLFSTAYEADPKQMDYIDTISKMARDKGLPVIWTHCGYKEEFDRLRRLGHAHQHARQLAEHPHRLGALEVRSARHHRRVARRRLHQAHAVGVFRNAAGLLSRLA